MSGDYSEEVQHGDGEMCVECNHCRHFCNLGGIFFHSSFVACTGTHLWGALEGQSSNSNTKVGRGQRARVLQGPSCSLDLSVDALSCLKI